MIASITGKILWREEDAVVIDVNGIGYRVYVPQPHLMLEELPVRLYTHHQVREDAQLLFGFTSLPAYDLFMKLISVKGIGPKTAMNIIGASDLDALYNAILSQDVNFIKKLPGIGPKSASQMILDLKGKLVEVPKNTQKEENPFVLDAIDALKSLGYKQAEVQSILKELNAYDGSNTNDYVRFALGLMLKRKG